MATTPPTNPERTSRSSWLLPSVLACVGLAAFALFVVELYRAAPPQVPDLGGVATVLAVPMEIPDFALRSQDGNAFGRQRLMGRWSFLFFGYTYCPTVCPATLSVLHQVRKLLESDAQSVSDTQVVFISVDPERDTLDRLATYVAYFDPTFVGVTGVASELTHLTKALGVYYEKGAQTSPEEYEIEHTQSVMLFDPQGRLEAVFGNPRDPKAIAEAFRKLRSVKE